ncbi:unnamed protein product, partial [Urochloa humidicola]
TILGDCLHSRLITLQCSTRQEEIWGKDDISEAPSDAQFQGLEAWKKLPPRITCSCDKRQLIEENRAKHTKKKGPVQAPGQACIAKML